MKLINFYGGPGAGKTTLSSGLFSYMKIHHHNVKLNLDCVQQLIDSGQSNALVNYEYIFATELKKIEECKNIYDYIICDCPLILPLIYMNCGLNRETALTQLAYINAIRFETINFFINRNNNFVFNEKNRVHDLKQSIEIDISLKKLLDDIQIPYIEIDSVDAEENLIPIIKQLYNTCI